VVKKTQNKLEGKCRFGKIWMSTDEKFRVLFKNKDDILEENKEKDFPYFKKSKNVIFNQPLHNRKVICLYKENGNKRKYYEVIDSELKWIYYKIKD